MKALVSSLLTLVAPLAMHAQGTPSSGAPDTAVKVTLGGFVDGYYAYDFDRPATIDRAFTTQAARHNEFNVNLAYLETVLAGAHLRGRLAAQFGTSVQANYAAEPTIGALSGPAVNRFIQEAFVGYQVASTLWLDGGVFFSPFGSENWISRDNWTYTRSLIAENSPYYEAGVKATWQATSALAAQVHVINGWQNISETNSDKALAVRVDYTLSPRVAIAYDGFLGNERPDTAQRQTRLWQEGIVTLGLTDNLQLRGTFDYGTQQRVGDDGRSAWRGWAFIVHDQLSPTVSAAARAEGYSDPEQVIVATGQSYGLRATGWSINVDISPRAPPARMLWRTEGRWMYARDPLFPARAKPGGLATVDPLLVSSVALTF